MTTKTNRVAPLVLTNPPSTPEPCKACGKVVKDMTRHRGTAACSNAAHKAMVKRLGFVEVWWTIGRVLRAAHVSVIVIRDEGKLGRPGKKKDTRRWYAPPEPVQALHVLRGAGIQDETITKLLRGPKDELERELAVAALAGRRDQNMVPFP